MVLIDTHVWLWWLTEPGRLPAKAARQIAAAVKDYEVCISAMSAWEIAMLVARGRLELATDYKEFIRQTEKLAFVRFIDLDNTILVNSVNLDGFPEKDPCDRIIVATAQNLGAILITKDETMRAYKRVRTIWD